MAYRLKRRRSLGGELSRIVAKEFDAAVAQLNQDGYGDEAVYEARKSVKKIRAVLRLLRQGLGKTYRVENNRLRTVAHQLSSVRDVDAMTETMKAVRSHYPRLVTPSIFAAINRELAARQHVTIARLNPDRRAPRAAHMLGQSARKIRRQVRRVSGARLVQAGVTHAYRRARKTMAHVRQRPEDLLFHAWRRRVKDHRYHMRLLESISATAHARARRLKRLDTWLGDDHNLVLLRATILNAPERFGRHRATAAVVGGIDAYQTTLRKRALKLGKRLFAHRPKVFRKSVRGWLHARSAAS